MKVRPSKSLVVRFFLIMGLLVATTVGLLSWANSQELRNILEGQLKDRLLSESSLSANGVARRLRSWEAQLATLVQSSLALQDRKIRNSHLENYLRTHKEFAFLGLYKLSEVAVKRVAMATEQDDQRAEYVAVDSVEVGKKIIRFSNSFSRRLLESNANERTGIYFGSIARLSEAPLVYLAKEFAIAGSRERYMVFAAAWQSALAEALTESTNIEADIVDLQGRILLSRAREKALNQFKVGGNLLVKHAVRSKIPQGFMIDYPVNSKRLQGAYYKNSRYRYVALVQQDLASAYSEVKQTVKNSLQWGGFAILLSILVAYFAAARITRGISDLSEATQEIADGQFDIKLNFKGGDEVAALSYAVNTMANRIEQLLAEQVNQAEIRKDLQVAQEVQKTLFPKEERQLRLLKVRGWSQSASETGGDWWGHFTTDEGVEYVFIADAVGHGVSAALVAAVAYSSCKTLVDLLKEAGQLYSPAQILKKINRVLCEAVDGRVTMSFFALMVDYHEGRIHFANAGQGFPLLYPFSEQDPRIKSKSKIASQTESRWVPITLSARGEILGSDPESRYVDSTMELKPGDKIVLFTDGLTECKNDQGEEWGRKGLIQSLNSHMDQSPESLCDLVIADAERYHTNANHDDDITLVVVEMPQDGKIGGYRSQEAQLIDDDQGWQSKAAEENLPTIALGL